MSNLYKTWYVNTKNENTRVIDSDALMGAYLKKNMKNASDVQKMDLDGFSAGLAAEDVGNLIKQEEEIDYVQLAKEEAEQILEDARNQAEEILRQAESQREEVLNTAKENGYREGRTLLEQEMEQHRQELEAAYYDKSETLETEYRSKQEHMEQDLVDVILEVFNKVFQIQFHEKKDILMHLINNAIMNIEGEKSFRIKVARDNVLFLENHKENILDRVGHDIRLEIVADTTMEGNDCIIETDSGVFECSLGVQLENLIKDIRSLCS